MSGFNYRELPKKGDACTTYQSFFHNHHPPYRIFTEIIVTPINKHIILVFYSTGFQLKGFQGSATNWNMQHFAGLFKQGIKFI
jgi:hypothetical protein